jgi:diguanylate cyclase (GGDEF)-like protein
LLIVSSTVFAEIFLPERRNYPLAHLCIPFLLWAALRFGELEAATAMLLVSGTAIWGTLRGYGPFVMENYNESLLFLQAFLGVVGVMTVAVAATASEHRRTEDSLRKARDELAWQAATDPLTGLANYRRFVEAFRAEVERSQRTLRPFALVLFDLDGLKRVNDTYGHTVGSRALCRVANVLRVHSRAIDTASRYGGDEFALILPETGAEGALFVGERVADRLAADDERPALSVSFGVGVYPDSGETMGGVLQVADTNLYAMKSMHNWKPPAREPGGSPLAEGDRGGSVGNRTGDA